MITLSNSRGKELPCHICRELIWRDVRYYSVTIPSGRVFSVCLACGETALLKAGMKDFKEGRK